MAQNTIFGDLLQSVAPQQNVRDYQHAARTFIDSLYRLSPKLGTLYHVFIDVNTTLSNLDTLAQIETGLLAKAVELPKYTVQNKIYNSYNRKTIQQEKVTYDPVTIKFHDDSADVVRNFWYDYFTHYYRDSDYQEVSNYQADSKYKKRQIQDWGYSPRKDNDNQPYLNSIRIYSLHQKRFSSYTLIRPVITAFQHGEHTAGEYAPIEHSLTVNYEAVLYDSGPVDQGTVLGFDQVHYDDTPSSLRNAGSVISTGENILKNIENGDLAAVIHGGVNIVNILTGSDIQIKQTPGVDLSRIGNGILQGQNPFSTVFAPTSASIEEGLQKARYKTGRIDL